MRLSRKVYAALGHLNRFNHKIRQTQYNRSTEHNVAALLTEKMFNK